MQCKTNLTVPTQFQEQRPDAVFIYGATAVGKTELVEQLAKHVPIEIVNMDMGQQYAPLTIGTAKPDLRHVSVAHHLFDTITTPVALNVYSYRKQAEKVAQEIAQRGNVPVFVGGSGFYLQALLFPVMDDVVNSSQEEHDHLTSLASRDLWKQLEAIDSDRAHAIHPNDTYRIHRALDVWKKTHKKPSLYKPAYRPLFENHMIVHVTRDRTDLYQRINDRTDIMLQQGWIEEVRSLCSSAWKDFLKRKKIIGYPALIEYCEGTISLKEVCALIKQKTRNYAKRQESFARMLFKRLAGVKKEHTITTINLTSCHSDLYSKYLLHILGNKNKK